MPFLTLVGAYLLSLLMPLLKTLHLSKLLGLEGSAAPTPSPSTDPPGMVCTPDGVCSLKRPPPAQKKEESLPVNTPVAQQKAPELSSAVPA